MLRLHDLTYDTGSVCLLRRVRLEVRPGDVLAVAGANGAGKSTLLKLAGGMLAPSAGYVEIGGRKHSEWKPAERAQFSAVLHQQTSLGLPFPVREVVMMGRYPHYKSHPSPLDVQIVAGAMAKAGIEALADRSYLDLSGGEQQRVQLARVFAQVWYAPHYETRYLFLDEPSNNLDIPHQHRMLQMAREFAAEGNCVMVVLHDLNLARQYAHRIALLRQGACTAAGTVEEVMTDGLLSHAYDYPIRILRHEAYPFPIVISEAQPPVL